MEKFHEETGRLTKKLVEPYGWRNLYTLTTHATFSKLQSSRGKVSNKNYGENAMVWRVPGGGSDGQARPRDGNDPRQIRSASYHLVMTNIAIERSTIFRWTIYFYGPCSMAMLNDQRVSLCILAEESHFFFARKIDGRLFFAFVRIAAIRN